MFRVKSEKTNVLEDLLVAEVKELFYSSFKSNVYLFFFFTCKRSSSALDPRWDILKVLPVLKGSRKRKNPLVCPFSPRIVRIKWSLKTNF